MKKFFPTLLIIIFLFSIFTQLQSQQQQYFDFIQQEAEAKNKLAKKLLAADNNLTENMTKYDVTYYQLNLEMVPSQKLLSGFIQMDAKALERIDSIELHSWHGYTIDSVAIDGEEALTFGYRGSIFFFKLKSELEAGDRFSAKIYYHGNPSSAGFGFDQHNGQPMIWSLSEPYAARTWWPCKDSPSDKADSADIIIRVPENLIVASNGLLREERPLPAHKKQYWWHEKYPITTYLISVAIYPYHVYQDQYVTLSGDTMPIVFYEFPQNHGRNFTDYAKTKEMMHAYASLFGEYPFVDEKYGHAEFLGWASGMEHQTLTSLRGVSESLIAHELAHQWWGDMITCNTFHHIWLNEGFATYCEALWHEWKYGTDSYLDYISSRFYYGPGTIYVEDPLHDEIFIYQLSYRKASIVLHMLRHVVGDSTFFRILREYYNDPALKYGTATTEQFQEVCERVSGMDLNDFFHEWIYEEGFPYYQYYYATKKLPDNKFYLFGIIRQIQSFGPIFHMPVDITIETVQGNTTFTVWTQSQTDTFSIILDSEPRDLQLDKDNWINCKKEFSPQPFFEAKSYQILDEESNNNGKWDAGETIKLILTSQNNGMNLENATVVLRTDDDLISITDSTASIGAVDYQQIFSNENQPFRLTADPMIYGKMVSLHLHVFENGEFVGYVNFYIPVGKPTMLLLDDDGNKDYESAYINALAITNNYYDYWESKGKNFPDSLTDYKTVLWFQGTQSINLLPSQFATVVKNFLNQGGNLIIFSQNLAEYVFNSGDADKISLMENYLGVTYESAQASESIIVGISGDPITSGMAITFNGPYGIDDQQNRDEISPVNGGVTIFRYLQSRKSAGIRFQPPNSDAKVVYFSFGLEGIGGPNESTASILIGNVFNWLNPLTTVKKEAGEKLVSFQLWQNYPNPFNPETTIRFNLPEKMKVTLAVFNISGQKIRELFTGELTRGIHEIKWDGKDELGINVASGIYFYRISAGNSSQQKKMVLIR